MGEKIKYFADISWFNSKILFGIFLDKHDVNYPF